MLKNFEYGIITIGSYQAHAQLTVYDLIWIIESLITLVFSLYFLRYIKKRDLIKTWYEEI